MKGNILTGQQRFRYARHLVLDGVGAVGQERICRSRVLIVGAGGLGSSVALYLAAAGVGRIGIADADTVDVSNLQRQVIHSSAAVGRPKVDSAKERILELNPDVTVDTYHEFMDAANARDMVSGYDFVVDATDNFSAKFLISDTCVALGKPFSHAGVLRFSGQAFTCLPGTPCLRCLFGDAPPAGVVPANAEAGVLGAVVGILGTVQATETLKYITGAGRLLTGRLLTVDAAAMEFRTLDFGRRDTCPACGNGVSAGE